ncbi:MAG: hypothetical protein HC830_14725 [Bacteroidetes bacterium]|nr:hypothetical protein [Bacteroidota bacterium]
MPAKGLDRDYITEYSLGYGEVWSIAVPNIKGGASGVLGNFSNEMKQVSPQFRENVAGFPSYWGEQAGTGGAFYFGAVIFLLFVLGMVLIKDNLKWAFLAIILLALALSWKHGLIIDFFIKHVPLFNKFRDTKMILTLAQVLIPLVALLFINNLLKKIPNHRILLYSAGITIGIFLLFYMIPSLWFSFFNGEELAFFDKQISLYPDALQQINQFQAEIRDMRITIFRADILRTILFMGVAILLIALFIKKKMAQQYFLVG